MGGALNSRSPMLRCNRRAPAGEAGQHCPTACPTPDRAFAREAQQSAANLTMRCYGYRAVNFPTAECDAAKKKPRPAIEAGAPVNREVRLRLWRSCSAVQERSSAPFPSGASAVERVVPSFAVAVRWSQHLAIIAIRQCELSPDAHRKSPGTRVSPGLIYLPLFGGHWRTGAGFLRHRCGAGRAMTLGGKWVSIVATLGAGCHTQGGSQVIQRFARSAGDEAFQAA